MKESVGSLVRNNKGAVEVISVFSKGASFRVSIKDGEDVVIIKNDSSFTVDVFNEKCTPDFTIFSTYDVMEKVFNSCGGCNDVKTFLINATRTLMDKENRKYVSLSVHSGFIKLSMNGYFKVLALGGRQFLKTLSEYGVGSLNTIRKKLANFTNR